MTTLNGSTQVASTKIQHKAPTLGDYNGFITPLTKDNLTNILFSQHPHSATYCIFMPMLLTDTTMTIKQTRL